LTLARKLLSPDYFAEANTKGVTMLYI